MAAGVAYTRGRVRGRHCGVWQISNPDGGSVMTRWQLVQALFMSGAGVTAFTGSDGTAHRGIITSVEREDGSGRRFNIRYWPQDGSAAQTVYVRVTD